MEHALGRIDVLVNNAGIQVRRSLLELSPEGWDRVLSTKATSAFITAAGYGRPDISVAKQFTRDRSDRAGGDPG